MKEIKLMIGVPSRDEVASTFMCDLVHLFEMLLTQPLPDPNFSVKTVQLVNVRGSILPRIREQIVDHAIEQNSTHLLFLDSDMRFPQDFMHRWLCLGEPVLAANCVTKKIPSWPTARQKGKREGTSEPVYTIPEKRERGLLEQVWRVGTGVMLLDVALLRKIAKPRFKIAWDPLNQDYVGEDWFFCEKLEQKGVPILVDHLVSWDIGHQGTADYTHPMLMAQKAAYAEQAKSSAA